MPDDPNDDVSNELTESTSPYLMPCTKIKNPWYDPDFKLNWKIVDNQLKHDFTKWNLKISTYWAYKQIYIDEDLKSCGFSLYGIKEYEASVPPLTEQFEKFLEEELNAMEHSLLKKKQAFIDTDKLIWILYPFAFNQWSNQFKSLSNKMRIIDFRDSILKVFINGNNKNIQDIIPNPEQLEKNVNLKEYAHKILKPAKESSF